MLFSEIVARPSAENFALACDYLKLVASLPASKLTETSLLFLLKASFSRSCILAENLLRQQSWILDGYSWAVSSLSLFFLLWRAYRHPAVST